MPKNAKQKKKKKEEVVEEKTTDEASEQAASESAPESAPEPKEVTILDTELDKLTKEAVEYKEKYTRLLAESENARKRLIREKEDMMQYAVQKVVVNFLTPLDQFEAALGHSENSDSAEVKNWAIGFQMLLTQFKDVLADNGIATFRAAEGSTFDPHRHEAVEVVETDDHPEGAILKEFAPGYSMGKRTIRPARVKVARPKKVENEKLEESKTEENQKED